MAHHTATGEPTDEVIPEEATGELRAQVQAAIGRDFPDWTIWRAPEVSMWYATGPCSCGCSSSRTLHASSGQGLREQLVKQEASRRSNLVIRPAK